MDKIKSAQKSQIYRDRKRLELESDLEEYYFINDLFQVYPPRSFEVTAFASEVDKPVKGDRKERNRITAYNSRARAKRRTKLLRERLEYLRPMLYQYNTIHNYTDETYIQVLESCL